MQPDVLFLSRIIDGLTDEPDCYEISRTIDERGVLLRVHIDEMQAGRIIGHGGETVVALRRLLRALGTKHDARYSLLIEARE